MRQSPLPPRSRVIARTAERRAAVTLEFLAALPVLLMATLAVLQFGIILLVDQAVVHAATSGAREAARLGAQPEDVAEVVRDILSVHGLIFTTTGTQAGDPVRVLVDYGSTMASPDAEFGDPAIPCAPLAAPGAQQVLVVVCVPLTDMSGTHPIPDWLSMFGFSVQNYTFESRALADLE